MGSRTQGGLPNDEREEGLAKRVRFLSASCWSLITGDSDPPMHTDIGLPVQEMFALLNKAFCSQIDGAHCVSSNTTEAEESKFIGDSDPSIAVCVPAIPTLHFTWSRLGLQGGARCEPVCKQFHGLLALAAGVLTTRILIGSLRERCLGSLHADCSCSLLSRCTNLQHLFDSVMHDGQN